MVDLRLTISTCFGLADEEAMSGFPSNLPFLFTVEVDGQPALWPAAPKDLVKSVLRKRCPAQKLMSQRADRNQQHWTILFDEDSLRRFLPDSGPHTIGLIAVYSQIASAALWEWDLSRPQLGNRIMFQRLLQVAAGPLQDPPILVRSNVARIRWTGSKWETPKD